MNMELGTDTANPIVLPIKPSRLCRSRMERRCTTTTAILSVLDRRRRIRRNATMYLSGGEVIILAPSAGAISTRECKQPWQYIFRLTCARCCLRSLPVLPDAAYRPSRHQQDQLYARIP